MGRRRSSLFAGLLSRFTWSMPPAVRFRISPERGLGVGHELVDHEVVAPRVTLAHAVDHGVDGALTAWAVTGGTSATSSAIARATRAELGARARPG